MIIETGNIMNNLHYQKLTKCRA